MPRMTCTADSRRVTVESGVLDHEVTRPVRLRRWWERRPDPERPRRIADGLLDEVLHRLADVGVAEERAALERAVRVTRRELQVGSAVHADGC